VPPPPEVVLPGKGDKAARLGELRERILACPECRRQRAPGAKPVFGSGSPDAGLFIVGEAPGAEEEAVGEPFVGPAGQILAKAIAAMGLAREDAYLAYLMRWRPVMANGLGDRAPTAKEAAFCLPYLRAEIGIVRPRVLVALGNSALNGLMGLEGDKALRITRQRGNWLELDGIPVMPAYHPSYLLRNPSPVAKREFWTDLLAVMERLGMPISERQRGFYAPPPQRGLSE
jgi:DNA polymerase